MPSSSPSAKQPGRRRFGRPATLRARMPPAPSAEGDCTGRFRDCTSPATTPFRRFDAAIRAGSRQSTPTERPAGSTHVAAADELVQRPWVPASPGRSPTSSTGRSARTADRVVSPPIAPLRTARGHLDRAASNVRRPRLSRHNRRSAERQQVACSEPPRGNRAAANRRFPASRSTPRMAAER